MGVQAPTAVTTIMRPEPKLAKPQSKPHKRFGHHHVTPTSGVRLPADVQELKEKILETHPEKLMRFSLSHMKRVAIPPVDIPKNFCAKRALSTVVSGKKVPFTKHMWENQKKKTQHLDMIDEYVLYR
ncbi:hypothetical protein FI667_g3335, partial [Globisporangium splendens]